MISQQAKNDASRRTRRKLGTAIGIQHVNVLAVPSAFGIIHRLEYALGNIHVRDKSLVFEFEG